MFCSDRFCQMGSIVLQAGAEVHRDVWEGFRASLRLLQPALVLPINPDLLSTIPDASSLPPPPPPPPTVGADGEMTDGDAETDSPMMWRRSNPRMNIWSSSESGNKVQIKECLLNCESFIFWKEQTKKSQRVHQITTGWRLINYEQNISTAFAYFVILFVW